MSNSIRDQSRGINVGEAPRQSYWIKTYGCQMNIHDSEIYAGLLETMGYCLAPSASEADVILVNTCSVRERAEDKLFSKLGRLRRMKKNRSDKAIDGGTSVPVIGVTGCIAQQRGANILERESCVDFVIGTRAIHSLPEILGKIDEGYGRQVLTENRVEFEAPFAIRADRVSAFVTIMEGCNNYCSFCIVPTTRGLETYRSAASILDEVRGLALRGYRQVTLLGQNVNSWIDPETGIDFPKLLTTMDKQLLRMREDGSTIERVRFLTSHPKDLSPRLIETMGRCSTLAKHLHLPVQSGSDTVLHRMNRHYTADRYISQIDALRASVPGVGVSTDLIVGFPGETAADFSQTLDLVRRIEFDSFYSFEYSQRPDTAATHYENNVDPLTKRERLYQLQELGNKIQARRNKAWIGRHAEVLIDGISKRTELEVAGRTSSNQIVNLPGPPELIGTLVRVCIEGAGAHSLRGRSLATPS